MEPSAKYVTDMTFDYGDGAVIDLTKEIQSIYSNGDETDRTICYTSPSFTFHSLAHINEVIDVFNSQTDTENSYGTIQASIYSRTLKDWTRAAPSSDIWSGYLLNHTSNTNLNFFWGYGGSTNRGSGGNRRLTKGLDFNTIVVPMGNIEVMDKSVYDSIDYDTYPTSQYGSASTPSTHNINLKTLDDNQNDYYVNNASFSSAYIWQPDTSAWVGTYINPSIMVDGEDAAGIMLFNFPFLGFTGGLRMTAESPDGHVTKTGGSDSNKVYKNLNDGLTTHYCLGFTDNFTIRQTRFATFDDMNNWGQAKYIELYGLVTGTHKLYFEHQEIDLGDSVLCLQFNIEMKYSGWWVPPHVYCDFQVYMKGSTVSKYLACMGLYVTYDGSAPTGLTPLTLHTSDKVWLGEMNESGNTTGKWVKGVDIYNYIGPNKTGNTDNPAYDPSGGGGGGGGYDDDPWHGATFAGTGVGGAGAFAKCYYMTSTELANLRSWMNSINVPEGFDPMQQIIGLSQVPVALSGSGPENVVFVNSSAVYDPGVTTRAVDTGVATQQAMGTPISYYLGSVDIKRRMQQRGEPYLDYDCQIELYLPLIGMFSLDTQAVMGRTIYAYAVLDPVSGTLAAYAYVSKDGQNLPIAYGSTTIGVDLPISAQQLSVSRAALKQANAQLGTSLLSSTLSLIAAATAGGKGSGTGAKTSTGSSGLSAAGIREAGSDYMKASQVGNVFGDFMNWGRTIRQLSYGNNTAIAGSFGGSTAQWSYPFTPYVKIIRPRYEKPSNYAHSQGIPCVQTKTIGSCTGFVQCIGADVSGISGATDLELQAIQAALSNGIYAGGGS